MPGFLIDGHKYALLVTLVAGFSPISRYSFVLQVAQGPRSPKLAIQVRADNDNNDIQTDCFIPCACARGN